MDLKRSSSYIHVDHTLGQEGSLTVITAFQPVNNLCSKVQLNLLCNVFALSFSQAALAHTSILTWLTEGRWSHSIYLVWLHQCCCYFVLMQCVFCYPSSLFSAWSPSVIQFLLVAGSLTGGWGPDSWLGQAALARGLCCQLCIQAPWLFTLTLQRETLPVWPAKMWGSRLFFSLLALAGLTSALIIILLLLWGVSFFWWLMAKTTVMTRVSSSPLQGKGQKVDPFPGAEVTLWACRVEQVTG